MTRRAKLWRAFAALFSLINLLGGAYAIANGEGLHATVHALLLALGVYAMWRLTPRSPKLDSVRLQHTEDRLDYLQQSVDAIAIELERIGEAQRYAAKLREERGEASPLEKPER